MVTVNCKTLCIVFSGSNDYLHCRFVWPHDVIYDVLREEGFSKVQSVPYEVDPAYTGDIDLQAYNDIHDQRVILAWK